MNIFSQSLWEAHDMLQAEANKAESDLEVLKTHYELRKEEFEAEHRRYLLAKDRIESEQTEKVDQISKKRDVLEQLKAQMDTEIQAQKALVDQQVALLDNKLEISVSEMREKFNQVVETLILQVGPMHEDFCQIYLKWTSKQMNELDTANQLAHVCGPNLGTRGAGVIQNIAQMGFLKESYKGLRQSLKWWKEQFESLERQFGEI